MNERVVGWNCEDIMALCTSLRSYCHLLGQRPGIGSCSYTTRSTRFNCTFAAVNNNRSEVLPAVDLGLVHPARQLEVPPGQPCLLGAERLRLGRIPQGAVLSRVISVRNCLQSVGSRIASSILFSIRFRHAVRYCTEIYRGSSAH